MQRSRIRYLLPLIAVTATSSIVWIAWPRTNPLLDRAVRVASVAGWELGGSYDWISNEEVLFFRAGVKKSAQTAHRLNTRTSEISEDRALTLAIRRIQPSYQWAWPYPELSLSPTIFGRISASPHHAPG